MRRLLVIGIFVFASGCAWREKVVRLATADLSCPEERLSLEKDGEVVRARGCDRRAVYSEQNGEWRLTDYVEPPAERQAKVKAMALGDLRCTEERVEVTALNDLYRATGCGRIGLYDGRPREIARVGKVIPVCKREGDDTTALSTSTTPAVRVGPEVPPELPPQFVAKSCRTETSEFRCTVAPNGRVTRCCAVTPVPFTEWAVAEALLMTEFQPALDFNGKPEARTYVFKQTLRPQATCSTLESR